MEWVCCQKKKTDFAFAAENYHGRYKFKWNGERKKSKLIIHDAMLY